MDKKKLQQIGLIFLGLLCFALAGLMIKSFSGRWKDQSPSLDNPGTISVQAASGNSSSNPQPDLAPSKKAPQNPHDTPEEETWVLYVTGAVKSPGVYRLPPGSRAYHLVDSAGGMTEGADGSAVNLASPLADGSHLHIPLKNQKDSQSLKTPPSNSKTPSGESYRVSTLQAPGGKRPSNKGAQGKKVNINTATAKELDVIPGIGPKMAERILDYRKANGPFRSPSEIQKVKGVGPKNYEAIKDMITVN